MWVALMWRFWGDGNLKLQLLGDSRGCGFHKCWVDNAVFPFWWTMGIWVALIFHVVELISRSRTRSWMATLPEKHAVFNTASCWLPQNACSRTEVPPRGVFSILCFQIPGPGDDTQYSTDISIYSERVSFVRPFLFLYNSHPVEDIKFKMSIWYWKTVSGRPYHPCWLGSGMPTQPYRIWGQILFWLAMPHGNDLDRAHWPEGIEGHAKIVTSST